MNNRRLALFFLALTLAAGIAALLPRIDYQQEVAQGDHGRDLYAAEVVRDGGCLYRDVWWNYGPLMPYYYAACYSVFGVSMKSVLIGRGILILLCGLVVFRMARIFAEPLAAFAVACAFWALYPDFYHTYAYTGGNLLILITICLTLGYITRGTRAALILCVPSCILLGLVKFNAGAAAFAACIVSCAAHDLFTGGPAAVRRHARFYYFFSLFFLLGLLLCYAPFVLGLPRDVLEEIVPSVTSSKRMFLSTPGEALRKLAGIVWVNVTSSAAHLIFSLLAALFSLRLCILFPRKAALPLGRARTASVIFSLLVFSVMTFHEFLTSGAPWHLGWGFPAFFTLVAVLLLTGMAGIPRLARSAAAVLIVAVALASLAADAAAVRAGKAPGKFLASPRGGIYAGNSDGWNETVGQGIRFIEENVGKNERIAAMPYDSLYCFLSGRRSGIRQQEMFSFDHPTERQEEEIVRQMEGRDVRWVVLSNRYRSTEYPLGTLGETHCRRVWDHLSRNFFPVATFGPWERNPDHWVEGHAVMILKRRVSGDCGGAAPTAPPGAAPPAAPGVRG